MLSLGERVGVRADFISLFTHIYDDFNQAAA
jgi:hypothetical protein